jgi:hypothetical protein
MKDSMPLSIEQNLESQIRVASRLKEQAAKYSILPAPFITLSRQFGCEAVAVAELLAQKLDAAEKLESGSWQVYSRKIIEAMADQQYSYDQLMSALDSKARGAIEEFVETLVGQISDLKLLNRLVQTMRATAVHHYWPRKRYCDPRSARRDSCPTRCLRRISAQGTRGAPRLD